MNAGQVQNDHSVTQRLERLARESIDIDKQIAKDPLLVAGCLTEEDTTGCEAPWIEKFANHPAVAALSRERQK